MKNINQLLLFILFALPQFLVAQDFATDLKKIRAVYDNSDRWHIQIDSKSWDLERNEKSDFDYSMLIKKKGEDMLVDMHEVQMLSNDQYMITYQKTNKVISCQKNISSADQQVMPDVTALLDDKEQTIKYKGVLDGAHFYTIKNDKSATPVIELYFQEDTYLLKKLVYHFQDNNPEGLSKTEMTMRYLDTGKSLADTFFSEKQFVQVDAQNKVRLSKKYQDHYLLVGNGLSEAK